MALRTNPDWPVLRIYPRDHLARIALPLGGIGAGTVSLGGRGDLRDWEVVNRPAKGFIPSFKRGSWPSFVLFTRRAGAPSVVRLLEGPMEPVEHEGDHGSPAANHGLPRFRDCRFAAAYPLGQVMLSDPDVPVKVRIEAFNPLIPGDADASGIPVAILRYVLINPTGRPVAASVCGSLPNFIGADGSGSEPSRNCNTFRRGKRVQGMFMETAGVPEAAEQWGTMALITTARTGTSHRTAWLAGRDWGDTLLDFWDDFSAAGRLEDRPAQGTDAPMASLAVRTRIPPRGMRTVTFLLTWHFPNRRTWTPSKQEQCCATSSADVDCIGNYYATQYVDAWDAAEKTAARLPGLEAGTVGFVRAFCESDLPAAVKEAALFNLSSLRSQTCFRTPDGRFFGWEGCSDRSGCCHGSCTHVWNYEQATAFLFGDLSRSMREVEFAQATDDRGLMSFRVNLPLSRARDFGWAAADGQMGCIMRLYRDWQLCGDDRMLRDLWPKARKALEFCWIPGGWDADRDGVMEGCQHNTMDVEYFGPNPQMGLWYLGALRAAEEMARHLGETPFADTCRDLFERGSRWIDRNLFNGEYYEHEIRPAADPSTIAAGLRQEMGARDVARPDYQLGAGCLVDQLVGQYMAHVCALGYLVQEAHVKKTLRSIMKYNFRSSLREHFNCLRSFATGDESALLMAAYPRKRPQFPFPYFTEVMTGFEYTAGVGMLYEGQTRDGLKCIKAVRRRYDGRKRNPFDEAECGHHYARAMASWAAVLALTGFHYSAVEKSMTFAAGEGNHFWSTGDAWGTCSLRRTGKKMNAELRVLHGKLALERLTLTGFGRTTLVKRRVPAGGRKGGVKRLSVLVGCVPRQRNLDGPGQENKV